MVLALLVIIGISLVGGIVLAIANIVSGGKILGENQSGDYHSDEDDHHWMGFGHDSNHAGNRDSRSNSAPSTIIGRAASTGRMRTMMDMMTAMTDFGTKGNFDTLFRFSVK